ncbi:hypothetical protein FGO68_gene15311 [Halteria grandinella]|uniref:Uncharacterized protein n=1 Tax=Halteria grandinella TaxID=5974 RepID=A0A8J8P056_HALGN|nr:hypothetical protein FGO68_gene15311 [Halteria grandinella]
MALNHSLSKDCGQASFPKVIGGQNDETYIQSVDYSESSELLVAGGYTKDWSLIQEKKLYLRDKVPIILIYEGAELKWSKIFNETGGSVQNVIFSNEDEQVTALFNSKYIVTLSAENGEIISQFNISTGLAMPTNADNFMLSDSNGGLVVALSKVGDRYRDENQETILLQVESVTNESPLVTWSKMTPSGIEETIFGLYWDDVDRKTFVMISTTNNDCFATRVNATNGQGIWKYQIKCDSGKGLQMSYYKHQNQTTDLIIGTSSQDSVYYRIQYKSEKPTSAIGLSAQYSYKILAMKTLSDRTYSILNDRDTFKICVLSFGSRTYGYLNVKPSSTRDTALFAKALKSTNDFIFYGQTQSIQLNPINDQIKIDLTKKQGIIEYYDGFGIDASTPSNAMVFQQSFNADKLKNFSQSQDYQPINLNLSPNLILSNYSQPLPLLSPTPNVTLTDLRKDALVQTTAWCQEHPYYLSVNQTQIPPVVRFAYFTTQTYELTFFLLNQRCSDQSSVLPDVTYTVSVSGKQAGINYTNGTLTIDSTCCAMSDKNYAVVVTALIQSTGQNASYAFELIVNQTIKAPFFETQINNTSYDINYNFDEDFVFEFPNIIDPQGMEVNLNFSVQPPQYSAMANYSLENEEKLLRIQWVECQIQKLNQEIIISPSFNLSNGYMWEQTQFQIRLKPQPQWITAMLIAPFVTGLIVFTIILKQKSMDVINRDISKESITITAFLNAFCLGLILFYSISTVDLAAKLLVGSCAILHAVVIVFCLKDSLVNEINPSHRHLSMLLALESISLIIVLITKLDMNPRINENEHAIHVVFSALLMLFLPVNFLLSWFLYLGKKKDD